MNGKLSQKKAPLAEALARYRKNRIVPFDVPGHKQGKGNPELVEFLGAQCLSVDVNSMKPLDNLSHPSSVIKEAEALAAEAFGADNAFFIVGGTSAAVQGMVMCSCKRGEKIIMPRNVHISAINALVLCGAIPVYVNPGANEMLGIALGMTVDNIRMAMDENPDAKAVFLNNPTLWIFLSWLCVSFYDSHTFNDYFISAWNRLKDFTDFTFIFTSDYNNFIAFSYI